MSVQNVCRLNNLDYQAVRPVIVQEKNWGVKLLIFSYPSVFTEVLDGSFEYL